MAEERKIVYTLEIKSDDSLNDFEKSVKNSNSAVDDLNNALNSGLVQTVKTFGTLTQRLEGLNNELNDVEIGSKRFNELQIEIAGVSSELKNIELGMEGLDSEQIASEMGGLVGGIGDVTAAFMLLGGEENETMQEMMKNLEMAMGISIGVKGGIEGIMAGMKLWKVIQFQLNAVMAANPVGAMVTAAVALTAVLGGLYIAYGNNQTAVENYAESAEKSSRKAESAIVSETSAMHSQFEQLKQTNIGTEERRHLVNKLNEEYGEYLPSLLTEKSTLEEIEAAQSLANKALMNSIILKSKQTEINAILEDSFAVQIKAKRDLAAVGLTDEREVKLFEVLTEQMSAATKGSVEYEAARRALNSALQQYGVDEEAVAVAEALRIQKNALDEVEKAYATFGNTTQEVIKTEEELNTKTLEWGNGISGAELALKDLAAAMKLISDAKLNKTYEDDTKAAKDLEQSIEDLNNALLDQEDAIDPADAKKAKEELIAIQHEYSNVILTSNQDILDKQLQANQEYHDLHKTQLEEDYYNGITSKEEYNNAIAELDAIKAESDNIARQGKLESDIAAAQQALDAVKTLTMAAINFNNAARDTELAKINATYTKKDKANADYLKKEKARLLQQKNEGLLTETAYNDAIIGLDSDYNSDKEILDNDRHDSENKAKQAAFEKNKKYQIANVGIDAASGIMSIWATAGELGPIAGPALALITSALIGATAIEQISTINSTTFTAAAGGKLFGDTHSQSSGGIQLTPNVLAEGGEFITNRASTEVYEPLLTAINNDGNGNGDTSTVSGELFDYERMAAAMTSKKTYVVSHDISDQQNEDTKITDRVEF